MSQLPNNATLSQIIASLQTLEGVSQQANLAGVIGSPVSPSDDIATQVSKLQTQKDTLATKVTAMGTTALGTETLSGLINKIPDKGIPYDSLGYVSPAWRTLYRTATPFAFSSTATDDSGNIFGLTTTSPFSVYKTDRAGNNQVKSANVTGTNAYLCGIAYGRVYVVIDKVIYAYSVTDLTSFTTFNTLTVDTKLSNFSVLRFRNGYVYASYVIGSASNYHGVITKLNPDLTLVSEWYCGQNSIAVGNGIYFAVDNSDNVYWMGGMSPANTLYKCAFGAPNGTVLPISITPPYAVSYFIVFGDVNDNGSRFIGDNSCYDISGSTAVLLWTGSATTSVYFIGSSGFQTRYIGSNKFLLTCQKTYNGTNQYGFAKIDATTTAVSIVYVSVAQENSTAFNRSYWNYNTNTGIISTAGTASSILTIHEKG